MRRLESIKLRSIKHLGLHLKIEPKQLLRLSRGHALYRRHEFHDKKGKKRVGMIPLPHFRPVADGIHRLLKRLILHPSLHGGVAGHSNITNAALHLGRPVVVNIDIKSFYPSITNRMVYKTLVGVAGCSPDVAAVLTRLTTIDHQLPQGSPPSSVIAAMVTVPLAKRLSALASQHGATYTQYVDDITFSGPEHIRKLVGLINEIVHDCGFRPHPEKQKVLCQSTEQTVTGVRVNLNLDATTATYQKVDAAIEAFLAGEPASIASLNGQIDWISQFNPGAGDHRHQKLQSYITARQKSNPISRQESAH